MSAVNAAGEGAVSGTTVGSTNDVTPPAGAPTGVTATQGNQVANVNITWNSVTGAGWYNVYEAVRQEAHTQRLMVRILLD